MIAIFAFPQSRSVWWHCSGRVWMMATPATVQEQPWSCVTTPVGQVTCVLTGSVVTYIHTTATPCSLPPQLTTPASLWRHHAHWELLPIWASCWLYVSFYRNGTLGSVDFYTWRDYVGICNMQISSWLCDGGQDYEVLVRHDVFIYIRLQARLADRNTCLHNIALGPPVGSVKITK